mgnify:CR=1 FL=1
MQGYINPQISLIQPHAQMIMDYPTNSRLKSWLQDGRLTTTITRFFYTVEIEIPLCLLNLKAKKLMYDYEYVVLCLCYPIFLGTCMMVFLFHWKVCQDFLRGRCDRKSCRYSHVMAHPMPPPMRDIPMQYPDMVSCCTEHSLTELRCCLLKIISYGVFVLALFNTPSVPNYRASSF